MSKGNDSCILSCRVACRPATSESWEVAVKAVSFEELEEAADGLEKVTISFEELEEAADGLEKVTISFEELEKAADGLEKVTVSFEEPEEAADGLEKVAVSFGEPEAVTGSPEDWKIHSNICRCMHIFLCLAALSCLRSEHTLRRYTQTWNLCFWCGKIQQNLMLLPHHPHKMTLKKPEKQQGQCLTVSSDKGQLCGLITWVTID